MLTKIQKQKIDLLTIGDTANDIFITLDNQNSQIIKEEGKTFLKIPYATKIPFLKDTRVNGVGNSANAAVSAGKLGIKTAFLTHIGNDKEGAETLESFKKNGVLPHSVIISPDKKTNIHYVLHLNDDRTILVHHEHYDYDFKKEISFSPDIPKFIYLSSLSSGTEAYHKEILDYVNKYDCQLIFQPGTFQLDLGYKKLQGLYESSLLLVVNVEEATLLIDSSPWKKNSYNKKLLPKLLHNFGQKLTIVTDGILGCYLYDGNHTFFLPIYPDFNPPVERTGAGDAFASTITSYLIKGYSINEAILRGPINSMNVVQYIGAQAGLLDFSSLEKLLKEAPKNYRLEHIEV